MMALCSFFFVCVPEHAQLHAVLDRCLSLLHSHVCALELVSKGQAGMMDDEGHRCVTARFRT
jgi:hypothetical protein